MNVGKNIAPRFVTGGLAIFAVLLLLSFAADAYKIDDAYIHFRIAETFAEYGQPYFNRNEPVMATSSPVWTYFLTLIALSRFPLPETVAVFNAAFTAVGTCLWTILLVDLQDETNLWGEGGMALGYVGVMVPSAVGLMETPLAMMLLALSGISLRKRRVVGWFLLALAVFTRLELIVFVPLFLGAQVLSRPYGLGKGEVGTAVLSFMGGACGVWATWGGLKPNTMTAKQAVYDIAPIQALKSVVFTIIPSSGPNALSVVVAGALAVLILYGLVRVMRQTEWALWRVERDLLWAVAVAIGGGGIACAYVIKAVHLHEWYQPLFVVPAMFSALYATRYSASFWGVAGILLLLPAQSLALFSLSILSPSYLPDKASSARVQRYLQVGEVLEQTFPKARLMTSEIGGLGYAFHGKILDGVGLVTPGALKHHPVKVGRGRASGGVGAIPSGYVAETVPELIVSYPVFAKDVVNATVAQQYKLLKIPAFSAESRRILDVEWLWGSNQLYVFVYEELATPRRLERMRRQLGRREGKLSDKNAQVSSTRDESETVSR
jgi:hypothetical protein